VSETGREPEEDDRGDDGGDDLRHRLLRLRDPDEGLPFPPPSIGNIAAAGLFASSALAAAFLGVRAIIRFGPMMITITATMIVWPTLLAFGAWQARPRMGRETGFRRAFAPVLLQALCYAMGGYFAALTVTGHAPDKRMALILLAGTGLFTFAGVVASFFLQHLARRAEALLFAQFTGPFLVMLGSAIAAVFIE